MKIVEIAGPPGVGKTTLLRTIEKSWDKGRRWIPDTFIDSGPYSASTLVRHVLFRLPYDKPEELKRAALAFTAAQQPYLGFCWRALTAHGSRTTQNLDFRFNIASSFERSYAHYQRLLDRPDARLCITEQGQIQRVFTLFGNSTDDAGVQEFAVHVPAPHALVILDADAETITNRACTRKIVMLHAGMDASAIQAQTERGRRWLSVIETAVAARGTRTIRIDAGRESSVCARELTAFLDECASVKCG